jgi:hypothetical protein
MLILGLAVLSTSPSFASDQKIVIDPINKKILVQSGNQTFSSESFSSGGTTINTNSQAPAATNLSGSTSQS